MNKKLFKFSIIFIIILGWIFSGWPRILQNPQIPPEINNVHAEEIMYIGPVMGMFDWSVELPEGVTEITVEVWGGGGGGKGGIGPMSGGGGGGGGYARAVISRPDSGVSMFYAGMGGIGGDIFGNPGANGEDSWFQQDFEIPGFNAHAMGGSGSISDSGASAGEGITGSYVSNGGSGGNGGIDMMGMMAGGGGGSSAGSESNGNNGGNASGNTPGIGGDAPVGGAKGGDGALAGVNGFSGDIPGAGGGGGGNDGGGFFPPTAGGDGGPGQVKITYSIPAVIIINVDPSQFDYGIMSEGEIKRATEIETIPPGEVGVVVFVDSNVNFELSIYGDDASSTQTTNWVLDSATSTDQYVHEFTSDIDTPSWVILGDSDNQQSIGTYLAGIVTESLDLRIHTPSDSTDQGPFSIPVTVVATEAS